MLTSVLADSAQSLKYLINISILISSFVFMSLQFFRSSFIFAFDCPMLFSVIFLHKPYIKDALPVFLGLLRYFHVKILKYFKFLLQKQPNII